MRLKGCEREVELLTLLQRGEWPTEEAGLLAHVAGCARCSEVLRVKPVLMLSRAEGTAEARLEAPGLLWWKAQARKRYATQKRIEEPMFKAQVFAWLFGLSAGLGALAAHASFLLDRLKPLPQTGAEWSSAWSEPSWTLIIAAGALTMLSGAVLYLATGRD